MKKRWAWLYGGVIVLTLTVLLADRNPWAVPVAWGVALVWVAGCVAALVSIR